MLKLISAESRASDSTEKDGDALLGDSVRLCSGLTAVPVYSRGDKKIVRMSKRFKTWVSAMEKINAVGFSGLLDAGPRFALALSWHRHSWPCHKPKQTMPTSTRCPRAE